MTSCPRREDKSCAIMVIGVFTQRSLEVSWPGLEASRPRDNSHKSGRKDAAWSRAARRIKSLDLQAITAPEAGAVSSKYPKNNSDTSSKTTLNLFHFNLTFDVIV